MRLFHRLLAAVSLSLIAVASNATPANPQNGVDYRTLASPQQTDSGNKVEVTSGLRAGVAVIDSPPDSLLDGTAVRVVAPPSKQP